MATLSTDSGSPSMPGYLRLYRTGELSDRARRLKELQSPCRLCPRECMVSRREGDLGICEAPLQAVVSSAFPHFGEEKELVGRGGSGTIFFAHCNLLCVFCQNYDISHFKRGFPVEPHELAGLMLRLQEAGCENINLVTPSHFVPQIIEALEIAVPMGLHLPLVYNCSGYEKVEIIRLLNGIVDIYMPDMKFATPESGARYAGAPDYFEVAKQALKEMHQQVGDLKTNEQGVAVRGLLVRHLVLPGNSEESKKILRFITEELGPDTYVNIMAQYYPSHQASRYSELGRRVSGPEMAAIRAYASKLGLYRGF